MKEKDTRKNIKISDETHRILKKYCDNNGIKVKWFISKLIKENCIEKK